ncbi:MAG: hypothetical protein Q7R41_01780, partial [Phycisphaerales bacterium]|nr:hypothetical protein [Phycisphaerales bacterium]
ALDAVRARVRNESTARADVTLRFIRDDAVVHLAFVRVLPETITTIASPETVDKVALSGVDDRGRALPAAEFVFGVDFSENVPAEYAITEEGGAVEQPPGRPGPPALQLTAPASAVILALGSTFDVQWVDSDSSSAVVSLFLRKAGSGEAGELVPLGPAIGAALDGINDAFRAVLEGVKPGRYEVVGRLDDGDQSVISIAPGIVQVIRDPLNAAPVVTIRKPASLTPLRNGDALRVEWSDADPDNNATIVFSLAPGGLAPLAGEEFVISPPIAEDPDGVLSDSAVLTIRDVLPGLYDLIATIDDGRLMGTDRVGGAVRVLPAANNDLPRFDFLEPFADSEVIVGGVLHARWTDSDDNDNARISLLLDPELGNVLLNGNEIVLASSIGEDDDGPADRIALAIPGDVRPGLYRLAGVITDGLTQVITRAPGLVTVRASSSSSGSTGVPNSGVENGGGNGDGSSVGNGPSTEITQVQPAVEVVNHPGELITVVVTFQEGPLPRRSRVYLTNIRYGGDFRVDLTPTTGPLASSKTYTLVVNTGLVPNATWPRSFDIELETIIEGATTITFSPRPIRIRQEVEIVDVRMLNYTCTFSGPITPDATPFVGIEWTWYGGGFDESEPPANVAFWLTLNGDVPENDVTDPTHMLLLWMPASPHVTQTSRIGLDWLQGMAGTKTPNDPSIVISAPPGLAPGDYHLVSVLDGAGAGRTVYAPVATPIQVCMPAQAATGGEPP